MSFRLRVPLLVALLLLLASALAAALIPAGAALDRRVASELRRVAVEDLGRAPMILDDRNAARAEALSMHAATVASTGGLVEALEEGRPDAAIALARSAAAMYGEDPVIVSADGAPVVGPPVEAGTVASLRPGESRVEYVFDGGVPLAVGIAPLDIAGRRLGAAGSAAALGEEMATALAALARADVTILGPDGSLVASTLGADTAAVLALAAQAGGTPEGEGGEGGEGGEVREVEAEGNAAWVASGTLTGAGTVLFSRWVSSELAALPGVRRGALAAGLLTLVLALAVGSLVAANLSRPVRGLAEAAGRVAQGDFEAPVPRSRIEEVDQLGAAFRSMRDGLRGRIEELAEANQALEDRQRRLRDLQADLIRQDRLVTSARMVAELAHEIRNPVANVRNCVEVVRRGLPDGSEGSRFAEMAIDELLRMHELAEQLLDMNRPTDPAAQDCEPGMVATQVATLAGVGNDGSGVIVRDDTPPGTRIAMAPDALRQVLFNLVDNAQEAAGEEGRVEIRVRSADGHVSLEVLDDGSGIDSEVLPRLFDPFFTTKGSLRGVGLGLFVAEGLAHRYGGRISAENRTDGSGARFVLDVPRSRSRDGSA